MKPFTNCFYANFNRQEPFTLYTVLSTEMYNKMLMCSFPISEERISKLIKWFYISITVCFYGITTWWMEEEGMKKEMTDNMLQTFYLVLNIYNKQKSTSWRHQDIFLWILLYNVTCVCVFPSVNPSTCKSSVCYK